MTLKDIAFKNLMRRKAKSGFIFAGLVIGVATVVAVVTFTDTMSQDIQHKMEKYGANILIVPHTDSLTLSYAGVTLGGVSFEMTPIVQSQLSEIRKIKNYANIAAVGPIVLGAVELRNQRALLTGVDFKATQILKPWWKVNGAKPGVNQLLSGSEAARILGLKIGQSVNINGKQMTVSGILSPTGSQDDQLLFAHMKTAQTLLGKPDEVSLVEVAALCNACPINDMVNQIAQKLPSAKVMAIQQVVGARMETLTQLRKFSFGLSIVVVLIGGLVVLVTLMGSVKERTREIGIFRAIGFRKSHIIRIILIETSVISLIAGLMGYLLGLGAVWAGFSLWKKHSTTLIAADPLVALGAICMALLVGLAASAYPAGLASRLDPNQALATL
ncbi:MAG: FtsX-like permease family protein [Desulfobacteraceae bacterium]|nr:FtsX-like permease family protein [Desulfobacteraceae bacterium]